MIIRARVQRHTATREAWAAATLLVEAIDNPDGEEWPAAGDTISASGPRLAMTQVGETIRAEVEVEEHSTYGMQVRVASYSSEGISSGDTGRWLERLGGVGPVLARAIQEHFDARGVDVLDVLGASAGVGLDGADPLFSVPGIGPKLASSIRESWQRVGASADIETIQWLDEIGCTRWEAGEVIEEATKRGMKARQFLEGDPYSLTQRKNFGFSRVDRIALRAGVSRQAPGRVEAATVFALADHVQQTGSTWAGYGQLVEAVVDMIDVQPGLAMAALGQLIGRGEISETDGGRGRRIHPPALLRAEEAIWRHVVEVSDLEAELRGALERTNSLADASPPAPESKDRHGAVSNSEDGSAVSRTERVNALLDVLADSGTTEDW